MMSDKQKIRKTIIAKLTDEQADAVERAVAASGKIRSVYLRDLVASDCAGRGVDWPEDENTHGGNRIIYPQPISTEEMMDAIRDALERGVNPFPQLSMDESQRLIYLLRKDVWLDAEQQSECQLLQQKACGETLD